MSAIAFNSSLANRTFPADPNPGVINLPLLKGQNLNLTSAFTLDPLLINHTAEKNLTSATAIDSPVINHTALASDALPKDTNLTSAIALNVFRRPGSF